MEYPQYKELDYCELNLKYKVKPYQCTRCEEIFTKLGAYLIHSKASLQGKCPDSSRLKQFGLNQLANGYWEQIPKTELAIKQTEILTDLEAKAFTLADFKKKPRNLNHKDLRNGRTFDQMACSDDFYLMSQEQIKAYQLKLKNQRPADKPFTQEK